jgi:hypothetical protein
MHISISSLPGGKHHCCLRFIFACLNLGPETGHTDWEHPGCQSALPANARSLRWCVYWLRVLGHNSKRQCHDNQSSEDGSIAKSRNVRYFNYTSDNWPCPISYSYKESSVVKDLHRINIFGCLRFTSSKCLSKMATYRLTTCVQLPANRSSHAT